MGTLQVCFLKIPKMQYSVNKIDLPCFPVVFFVVSRHLKPFLSVSSDRFHKACVFS